MNDLILDDTGDMNWIIPGKLLAMTSPSINRAEGMPPLNYIDFFKKANVSAVVRLNEKLYIDEDFYRHGIRVYPMELTDGSAPNENMITDFLMQAELEIEGREGAVAVHCRAGQGRTGTFCASYVMFKYGFTAKMAIAWVRMCRPGSVYGANQQFLCTLEHHLGDLMFGKCMKDVEKRMTIRMEINPARPYKHAASFKEREKANVSEFLP